MAHILIVDSRFYHDISDELIAGSTKYLEDNDHSYEIISVKGAFEIPAAISFAHKGSRRKYDGYLALGCVIRGETTHYDYVCSESARGLNQLALEHDLPIGYGILTVENFHQAMERAAVEKGNKGAFSAEACIMMIKLKDKFGL